MTENGHCMLVYMYSVVIPYCSAVLVETKLFSFDRWLEDACIIFVIQFEMTIFPMPPVAFTDLCDYVHACIYMYVLWKVLYMYMYVSADIHMY